MCYDADSCRAAAMALGLEIGGAGHDFTGIFSTVGCYAYNSGEYRGHAYYGFRSDGTEVSDESQLLPVVDPKYRIPGTHGCSALSKTDTHTLHVEMCVC